MKDDFDLMAGHPGISLLAVFLCPRAAIDQGAVTGADGRLSVLAIADGGAATAGDLRFILPSAAAVAIMAPDNNTSQKSLHFMLGDFFF